IADGGVSRKPVAELKSKISKRDNYASGLPSPYGNLRSLHWPYESQKFCTSLCGEPRLLIQVLKYDPKRTFGHRAETIRKAICVTSQKSGSRKLENRVFRA